MANQFCRIISWSCLLNLNLYAPRVFSMQEIQQESLLCQQPQDVLYLIAEQLGSWKEINRFGSTCKNSIAE